jgi:hypothetical protein
VRPFAWTKPPLQHLIRCAGFTYQSDPLDRPGMARPGGLLAMSAFPERVVGCRVSLHIVLLEMLWDVGGDEKIWHHRRC